MPNRNRQEPVKRAIAIDRRSWISMLLRKIRGKLKYPTFGFGFASRGFGPTSGYVLPRPFQRGGEHGESVQCQ